MENDKQSTTAVLHGDYAQYPESIRDTFSRLAGEACELRTYWSTYYRLYMDKQEFTAAMEEGLGEMLNFFQFFLEEQMFLSIARFTDRDARALSLRSLLVAIPAAKASNFANTVNTALSKICAAAANAKEHRHKRIAHFDLRVSVGEAVLPVVIYSEIRGVLEQIEEFLNLFSQEFDNGATIFFETPPITGLVEATVYKARAYDQLEAEGKIPDGEWRRRAEATHS